MKLKVIAQAENNAAFMNNLTGENMIDELIESVSNLIPSSKKVAKQEVANNNSADVSAVHTVQRNLKM